MMNQSACICAAVLAVVILYVMYNPMRMPYATSAGGGACASARKAGTALSARKAGTALSARKAPTGEQGPKAPVSKAYQLTPKATSETFQEDTLKRSIDCCMGNKDRREQARKKADSESGKQICHYLEFD